MPIRILLVDDQPVLRCGLRAVLSAQPDFEVIGEANDARSAYALAYLRKPDLVVLGMWLPDVSGISAARELCRRNPNAKALLFAARSDDDLIARALCAGARGCVDKEESPEALVEAVRAIIERGEIYLPPRVSRFAIDERVRERRARSSDDPTAALSVREGEIFELLVRGGSNSVIATHLCISENTVGTHRARILKKLRLHSLADMVRFAARSGFAPLLSPPD